VKTDRIQENPRATRKFPDQRGKIQDFEDMKQIQTAIVFKSALGRFQGDLKKKLYPIIGEAQKSLNNSKETRKMVRLLIKDRTHKKLIEKFKIYSLKFEEPPSDLDPTVHAGKDPKKSEPTQPPDFYSQTRAKFLKSTRRELDRRMNHGFLKFASDRIFNDKAFSESIEIDILENICKRFPYIGGDARPSIDFAQMLDDGKHLVNKHNLKKFVVDERMREVRRMLDKQGILKERVVRVEAGGGREEDAGGSL
jgi:hypothetical protein